MGQGWLGAVAARGSFDLTDASDPSNQSAVAQWSSGIAARIAQIPGGEPPAYVLINIGAHDMISGLPDGATWRANYTAALDAINAAFPDARIYVMKPWQQGDDADGGGGRDVRRDAFDTTDWRIKIDDCTTKAELDVVGEELKNAKGIPGPAMTELRRCWGQKARLIK